MDEAVLPALGRARIDVQLEELSPDEVAQPWLECRRVLAGDRRQPGDREAQSEHGRLLHDGTVRRVEAVQPRRDQGLERLRNLEVREVADGAIGTVDELQLALVEEHPDRLDRVEGNAVRTIQDQA